MELRQFRYFQAVAEEQHLTRAADRLGLRATSLSQQILALEKEVGVPLFTRHPGGMAPTAAGRALLPKARAVLAAVDDAVFAARSTEQPVPRIGITPGAPPAVVAALGGLVRRCSAQLYDLPVAAQLGRLRAGALDAGVVVLPADTDGLTCREISVARLGVVIGAGHPLAAEPVLDWSRLGGQDLLWFDRDLAPGYHDAVLSALGWQPRRIRRGEPRRGLFTAELFGDDGVVALRPRWAAEGPLVWRPLREAPVVRHALVWRTTQHDQLFGETAAGLVAEAVPDERPVPPDGRR